MNHKEPLRFPLARNIHFPPTSDLTPMSELPCNVPCKQATRIPNVSEPVQDEAFYIRPKSTLWLIGIRRPPVSTWSTLVRWEATSIPPPFASTLPAAQPNASPLNAQSLALTSPPVYRNCLWTCVNSLLGQKGPVRQLPVRRLKFPRWLVPLSWLERKKTSIRRPRPCTPVVILKLPSLGTPTLSNIKLGSTKGNRRKVTPLPFVQAILQFLVLKKCPKSTEHPKLLLVKSTPTAPTPRGPPKRPPRQHNIESCLPI